MNISITTIVEIDTSVDHLSLAGPQTDIHQLL